MHHFHLSRKLKKPESKFVERSDYLLFAIITQEDAFFVDVNRTATLNSLDGFDKTSSALCIRSRN